MRTRIGFRTVILTLTMALLTAGVVSASPDADQQAKDIVAMYPYATVDAQYVTTLDTSAAAAAGVPTSAIDTAISYATMNNKVVAHLTNGGTIDTIPMTVLDPFASFFERTQSIGLTDIEGASVSEVCGGDYAKPHPVPKRQTFVATWATQAEVEAYLTAIGYHKTAGYAGGGAYDWTRVVDAYSCPGGPFRAQASVTRTNGRWTFTYQTPEPNPEIFSYKWPVWWWGAYVAWWHKTF